MLTCLLSFHIALLSGIAQQSAVIRFILQSALLTANLSCCHCRTRRDSTNTRAWAGAVKLREELGACSSERYPSISRPIEVGFGNIVKNKSFNISELRINSVKEDPGYKDKLETGMMNFTRRIEYREPSLSSRYESHSIELCCERSNTEVEDNFSKSDSIGSGNNADMGWFTIRKTRQSNTTISAQSVRAFDDVFCLVNGWLLLSQYTFSLIKDSKGSPSFLAD